MTRTSPATETNVLGMESPGEVAEVGADVAEFELGDQVFGVKGFGAHAQYVSVKESSAVSHMPSGMTFEEAAAVSTECASRFPASGKPTCAEGRSILVYGASGSVGTAAVQLARHWGAHVTAVCTTQNVELMRSLGAHEVIDHLEEDFAKNSKTYDVVFDAMGKHSYRRIDPRPGRRHVADAR